MSALHPSHPRSGALLTALGITLVLVGLIPLILLLAPPQPAAAAETVANAAGRYDALVLRDLGGKRAALVQLVAAGGAFTPVEIWRSKKGAFDMRKATFAAGDVNGDGIGDGIVLYDLGHARSRLYVYLSNGASAQQTTAWTSKRGAFAKGRARIAVGDVNGDGRDDVVALYPRGRTGAVLYRFTSTGAKFRRTTGWSARRGFSCARAQLAAGDANGDGRDDAIVLYKSTKTSSRLFTFVAGASKFTKKVFWRGKYSAGRARLAAGDADSDGDCDVVTLYRTPENTGRLDVFLSSKKAFAKPAGWYEKGSAGVLPFQSCRLAVGDISGDGRADAVLTRPVGSTTSSFTTCVSSGSAFDPQVWCEAGWAFGTLRTAAAPSRGLVVSDAATVLDEASMSALRAVDTSGTFTFAGATAQLDQVQAGDVLLSGADANFPHGICRKVTGVSTAGGRLQVTTAQATLADIIDEGEIAFTQRITSADVTEEGIVAPGVRLRHDTAPPGTLPVALGGGFTEGIGFDVTTTIAEKVEIEGSVWLTPTAYIDWDIGWTGLNSAAYTQTLDTTTELTASLKASIDKEIKQTIYKQTLAVVTIMVGPVPVVITPEFEVYVGASGEASAGVTAGVTMTTETTVGVNYDGDDWHHSESFSREVTWQKPQLFGGLELKGFLGAGISFKLYDVVGPYAKVEAFEMLEADTSADPWWTLKAGLDAEIGVEVEVADITIAEVNVPLHLFEYVIDQAGTGTAGDGSGTYKAPSVRGAVLDAADATPVKFASVELYAGSSASGSVIDSVETAGDGSYVFSGLAAGQYTMVASKSGFAQNSRTATVIAGVTTTGQDISIARNASQGVSGTVYTDPGGAPIPGAYVSLRQVTTGWFGYTVIDSDYAEADGTYEFTGVPPGDYYVYASAYSDECFSDRRDVTVTAAHLTTGQDLHLVQWAAQGISGRVTSALDGSGIAGLQLDLREGYDAPCGVWVRSTTTKADGSYAFTGVDPGDYTVVGQKAGYVDGVCNATVTRATITPDCDLELAPCDADGLARPVDGEDFIRYPMFVGVVDDDMHLYSAGTYEVWFKLHDAVSGEIAQVTLGYGNWPGGVGGYGPIMELIVDNKGKLMFRVNRYGGSGPMTGDWYYLTAPEWNDGEIEAQVGTWYHVAAEFGPAGAKLFVNGKLRASDPSFTGAPEADRSDGTLYGGYVSIGDNETVSPDRDVVPAEFKELRVSDYQRYDADFTPPSVVSSDAHTVLLDHLVGGTNGEDHGFVWVPWP